MKKTLLVLLLALAGCSGPPPNKPIYALLSKTACDNLGAKLISWEVENVYVYRYGPPAVRISVQCSDKIQVIVDYDPPTEPARSSV